MSTAPSAPDAFKCYFADPSTRMSCCIDLGEGKKVSSLSLAEFHTLVSSRLWENGVICIKNQHGLSQEELVKATAMLGTPIRLPKQLAFNNRDANFPEITRVGNIGNSNEKMNHYFDAKYWHTDGSFWPGEKRFITNWLATVVKPKEGGNTAFIDMQQVYNSVLTDDEGRLFHKTRFVVRHRNLFAQTITPSASDDVNSVCSVATEAEQCGIPTAVVHDCVYNHPITGVPSLYVGTNNSYMVWPANNHHDDNNNTENACDDDEVDPLQIPVSNTDRADKIIAAFATNPQTTVYVHRWEDGDVLLWDNSQTMHRGMGGIGAEDRRLLYRTQSMVLKQNIDEYEKAMAGRTA